MALNLFSAVCASLVLVQLARTVMVLPHDRTQDQRDRESHPFGQLSIPLAWITPLFAVIACGLQLTFWEHSTNGTPEMFDLLLFAYVVRSLLEYRLDEREARLYRAAFVQGIAMANNFAMIGFFPIFVAALIWIRGFSFFRIQFLTRMALWGLIGLSLYLFFPLLAGLSKNGTVGMWEPLRANFFVQRQFLAHFVFSKTRLIHGIRSDDSDPLWMLGVTSLLPLVLLSIRWPSHFGDTSRLGTLMTKWVFHVAHAFLFVLCVWVCFDSPISPRYIMTKYDMQTLLPLLTFYYLGALAIGYFAGYFLLVFRPLATRNRRVPEYLKILHWLATTLTMLLLIAVAAGLPYRNLHSLRLTNGAMMRDLARGIVEGLPPRAVLLSDDWRLLQITQLFLAKAGKLNDYLPLDTAGWRTLGYHQFMRQKYPRWWPEDKDNGIEALDDVHLVDGVSKLAKSGEIIYLHPSFGLIFEYFSCEPHYLVQRLKPAAAGPLLAAPLPRGTAVENEAFWTRTENQSLKSLVSARTDHSRSQESSAIENLFAKAHLSKEKNVQVTLLGYIYSRALNNWAVELQKANDWEKAAERLDLALAVNPENVAAKANLGFNKLHSSGQPGNLDLSKPIEQYFGDYRKWDQAVRDNGPYDEPTVIYGLGYFLVRNRHFRQASQCFDRLRTLFPNQVFSRLWLANLQLMYRQPNEALALVDEIRSLPDFSGIEITNAVDLLSIEAGSYFEKKEPAKAMQVIESQLQRQTNDSQLVVAAVKLYSDNGRLTNAYALLDDQLKAKPDDPLLLINRGVLLVGEAKYQEAIRLFGNVLSTHTNMPTAQIYRAIAYVKLGDFDKAKQDYETVFRDYPNIREVLFGLHDISYNQKNLPEALDYGKRYLSNAVPIASETKLVWSRVKAMEDEISGKDRSRNKKGNPVTP